MNDIRVRYAPLWGILRRSATKSGELMRQPPHEVYKRYAQQKRPTYLNEPQTKRYRLSCKSNKNTVNSRSIQPYCTKNSG